MTTAYVTLRVGPELYAVPASTVNEIVLLQPLTRVPSMPPAIRGLMNLRGTVMPVVDLARQLGLGETAATTHTCAVVIDAEADGVRAPMGIITDEVQNVIMLAAGDIEPPPAFGATIDTAYLAGMTRLGGRYTLILDLTRILAPDELLAALEESSHD
ncbi:MAG TPA: chemotaxis protein CheW [Thermoanaerobaculia bacterium]|jgi:purine-binding chemotaxis protein CheW